MGYLLPLWTDLGRVVNYGNGPQVVPFSEVQAFAQIEGLTTAEARHLRKASEAYVSGYSRGRDVFATPPWEGEQDG